MHYNNYNSDSDYNSGYDTQNDQVAFIDYEGNGLWAFGILEMGADNIPEVRETIDRDSNINTLVKRAIMDWGVDPTELMISPCAREIATMALRDKKIGD
jgi:hypothetical protein